MKAVKFWSKKYSFGSVVASALIIAGCATESAKSPDLPSRQTVAATGQPASSAPAQKPVASSSAASSGSSLDALRQGKPTADGPLKTIHFAFDSYALTADARMVLKANAEWLKANPASRVEIEGHCDERGTTEYNLALGAKRARAAMDYLITLGVNPARIKTTSYGEELPMCREATEACYLNNRRARFVEVRSRPTS